MVLKLGLTLQLLFQVEMTSGSYLGQIFHYFTSLPLEKEQLIDLLTKSSYEKI